MGMWVPVHDAEWDGDVPIGFDRKSAGQDPETGEVIFKGDALPWQVGTYEASWLLFAWRLC